MSPRNLVELHRLQAERLGPRPALRYKHEGLFHDLTWDQYRADVLACAAALVKTGVRPGNRVALLSENRVEWLIVDLAIMAVGAVNVPQHAPLTAEQVRFQLADSEAVWVFVSSAAQLEKVRQIRNGLPKLGGGVVFDASVADLPPGFASWRLFHAFGRHRLPKVSDELARREAVLGPDDLATIMYTSGTTGNPKGVMLTHGNLLSNTLSTLEAQPPGPDDVQLNWLPFSHIYARTLDHYTTIAAGTLMALAESAETLVDDLKAVQPMFMHSVPRFYEKVLTSVASSDPAKSQRRLRDVFGPRLRWLCSGGAPLPLAVAEAYQAAGICVLQGYGLTECAPVISFNRFGCNRLGTVGLPLPGVEVKIGPDGEVLTRGPHVMPGYWNNATATTEALRDGWLHTGDLGELDADGFLSITGRKKDLLVMSSGKKVVPNHIEGLLLADPCIDQAVVFGEGRRFLSALIVPHWENVRRELGAPLDGTAEEEWCRHPAVCEFLQRRLEAALRDVSPWEKVKKFIVRARPFSVAADELTVSLKLRRGVVLAHHEDELEALYRE